VWRDCRREINLHNDELFGVAVVQSSTRVGALILPHGRRIHRQAQSSLHAAKLSRDVATIEPHRHDRQLVALDEPG
jgi:hypothetical protein